MFLAKLTALTMDINALLPVSAKLTTMEKNPTTPKGVTASFWTIPLGPS